MTHSTSLGERLRSARETAGLSQQAAAQAMGIDRVNLSYWETAKRAPGLKQLQQAARTYGTTVAVLLNDSQGASHDENNLLISCLSADEQPARRAISHWLTFLDEWANLREEVGDPLPGKFVSSIPEGRSPAPITDTRRAPTLAAQLRSKLQLGDDAIPDLIGLLDRMGILVNRADLGEHSRISGVFYNHSRLGAAILINTCHVAGRQIFTLAHELAHAQFHYQEQGLISRTDAHDAKERFANKFAAHFLVPNTALRSAIEQQVIDDPYDVVRMQANFRVSYAMMLNRLRDEGLIGQEQYDAYRTLSPTQLASRLQIDVRFLQGRPERLPELETFPPSVIDHVINYLNEDILSVPAAASLLDVPQEVVAALMARYEKAGRDEELEFELLPDTTGRRPVRAGT
jgi:Zn-dependent peptidase ImmA (M78 family)/transcriptional regulator with XRE-family HTH domain